MNILYKCFECGHEWIEQWECACDSECPAGHSVTAFDDWEECEPVRLDGRDYKPVCAIPGENVFLREIVCDELPPYDRPESWLWEVSGWHLAANALRIKRPLSEVLAEKL